MKTKKFSLPHAALIIAILLISGLVFASLAEDLVNHETFSNLDPTLGNWLLTRTSLTGDQIFSLITFMGNALIISSGTGLLGLWLAKEKYWNHLCLLFSTVGGAAILNFILKNIFLRPRPDFPLAYSHETGYSFPSGHAMISLAFYGIIAYLITITHKDLKIKIPILIGLFILSVLIGFSRLYLGVHYLTDVLAGWAAGGLWMAICILGDNLYLSIRRKK